MFGLEVLTGKPLSFLLEFIDKTGAKFNVYKGKLTPFKEISPQELNNCLQKFYLSARKSDDCSRSVIARQNFNSWQQ